jgi:hypothetical protein
MYTALNARQRYRRARIMKSTNGIAFHFAACPVTNLILLYYYSIVLIHLLPVGTWNFIYIYTYCTINIRHLSLFAICGVGGSVY